MVSVYLQTDRPDFQNDIAEELRLFLPGEVLPCPEGPPLSGEDAYVKVLLDAAADPWIARALCKTGAGEVSYVYEHPAVRGNALVQKRYQKRCVKIAAFRALRQLVPAYTPWGSLTGIRPTHLLRELIATEGEAEALRIMREEFDVAPEKLALTREILAVQQPFIQSASARDVDVYIGVPFCRSRCLYCSFASEVRGPRTDMRPYLDALKADIRLGAALAQESGRRVRSMYMGGGTPTVLTESELDEILSCALESYGGFGAELTVEAGRPDTISREKLSIMKRLGVGRISINPQSMQARTLEIIGRSHMPEEILSCYAMAREVGFACINMDVIAGLPGESLADVQATLDALFPLAPENLTVHTLAIKRSSRLKQRLEEFPLVSAEEADRMVLAGADAARQAGLRPYYMYRQKYMRGNLENVGYALPGKECMYNIDMMEETTSILAHGAGAMNKRIFGGEHRVERIPNPKDIATYIGKLDAVHAARRALFLQG